MDILDYMRELQIRASSKLQSRLQSAAVAPRLEDAMRYAVQNGGKRIRPILAYASAQAVGGEFPDADDCACALELVHAYSLVHDDLPAMDNDDLRRGKPTCHIQYDEASAILVGDALQSLAFEILAASQAPDAPTRLAMILALSQAIGWRGMVAGQSIDIGDTGDDGGEEGLAGMHALKTGALIRASLRLGALSTGKASPAQLDSLDRFGRSVGLAFQIKDDILDVEGDTGTLGKQQGKDQALNKITYTSLLGVETARQRMQALYAQGIDALSGFGDKAAPLAGIARYIVERTH